MNLHFLQDTSVSSLDRLSVRLKDLRNSRQKPIRLVVVGPPVNLEVSRLRDGTRSRREGSRRVFVFVSGQDVRPSLFDVHT